MKMEDSSSRIILPANIIVNILSRLDVKNLLRLRCVCKTWFKLISSPSFQDLHRSRSQHNLLFLFRSATSYYNYLDKPNRRFSYPFCSTDIAGAIHARFTVRVDDPIKIVLRSCCGLVCFATDTRIYVSNPATREILALPVCPQGACISGFGFGYLESIKAYKVVRLIHRQNLDDKIECSVSTIRPRTVGAPAASSNSWRVLNEECPYLVEQFSYPVFAKDSIYWKINLESCQQPLRKRRRSNPINRQQQLQLELRTSSDYIVCFNIKEEKFSTITHPADWIYVPQNFTQLADLGGMLCMVEISNANVVVWVLKYVHNSFWWHKGGFIDIRGIDRRVVGEVKCLHDGEIIFSSLPNVLLFYNVKKKRFRQVPLPIRAFEFGIYWESFFPLGEAH